MEHHISILEAIKETLVENIKSLIVLTLSIATAHTPLHDFLNYDWKEWMPFLEVFKTFISIFGICVSTLIIILNYLKKRK